MQRLIVCCKSCLKPWRRFVRCANRRQRKEQLMSERVVDHRKRPITYPPPTDELIQYLWEMKYDWIGSLGSMMTAFEFLIDELELDADRQECVRIVRESFGQQIEMAGSWVSYLQELTLQE